MVGDRPQYLPREGLGRLIKRLGELGYEVLGPTVREGVISLRPIGSVGELAGGVTDEQGGGRYRLVAGDSQLSFEYVVGPDGPKGYLFPSRQTLLAWHVEGEGFALDEGPARPRKLAMVGIRPCELAAIGVQDRVFGVTDPGTMRCESEGYYTETRRQLLTVVVNCTRPGGTCFCVSMGTGPEATAGFDLAMTELREGFVVRVGSGRGEEAMAGLGTREATGAELELAELKLERAKEHMGRRMETAGLPELMNRTVEHPNWDEVAKRCLSCGNCTMVCPTCFCSTVQDSTDLSGAKAMRVREWESCFTHQFTYLTAGPVRHTIRGRYRHWLRHKLGTWHEQFGCSGCVGCGRCITWCPVGIDLTEEVRRLRGEGTEGKRRSDEGGGGG